MKLKKLVEWAKWKPLVQWAATAAEILVVAGILAATFAVGRYISTQEMAQQTAAQTASEVGIFEGHGDVGKVVHAGSVEYDAAKKTYTIAASGYNIWFDKDAFQFAWKKVSGDVSLTADISFLGKGVQEHRKAALMVRQSLDADSAYADIAVHGNGMTALQTRDEKGALTHEVQALQWSPKRVRLEKHGDYYTMWFADGTGKFQLEAGSARLPLKEPFYVGIGLSSHDDNVVEKAVFSNVELKTAPAPAAATTLYSLMEIVTVASTDRTAIYTAEGRFEAPNWMPDGKNLLFNRNGHIEKIPVTGAVKRTDVLDGQSREEWVTGLLDTGFAARCNNDHLISPDGTQLGISDNSQEEHKSLVYIVPIEGGTPRRITQKSPSYLHGWSPDGKTLAFVGERNGDFDIYAIPAEGGEETRLTTAKGLDDGPEYTPEGKYIYFNSERTGHMQIWRMRADGSEQEQVTFGEENDWFPHISPNGEWMVFLSYDKSVSGHPENKDVMLRLMSLKDVGAGGGGFKDAKITVLAKLFGGQGTINVPSWSPDGKRLAFVSYQLVPKEGK